MRPEQVIPSAKRLIARNAHLLRKSNWKKLKPLQKRKAILLDAMKSLLTGVYIPQSQYEDADIFIQTPVRKRRGSLKDVLGDWTNCHVCQRGMLLLSCIRFNNMVSISEYNSGVTNGSEELTGLDAFIPYEERTLMEATFEGYKSHHFKRKYVTTKMIKDSWGRDDVVEYRTRLSIAIFLNAYMYGEYQPNKWTTVPIKKRS